MRLSVVVRVGPGYMHMHIHMAAPPEEAPPESERVERGEPVRLSEFERLGEGAEGGICSCSCTRGETWGEICISTGPSIQLSGDADLAFWRCSSEICISASAW